MYTEDVKELGRGLNKKEKRNNGKLIFGIRVKYRKTNTYMHTVTHPQP